MTLTLTSKTFWEDFTCLDLSQCMLNKNILGVAAKYVDSDLSDCLVQYLNLGIKVCLCFLLKKFMCNFFLNNLCVIGSRLYSLSY